MVSITIISLGILFFIGIILILVKKHFKKIKITLVFLALILACFLIVGSLNSLGMDIGSPTEIVSGIYYSIAGFVDSFVQILDIGRDSVVAVGKVIHSENTNNTERA